MADSTLIRGAYQANKPIQGAMIPGMDITQATDKIASDVDAYVRETTELERETFERYSDEYNKIADKILNSSELRGPEFRNLYRQLQEGSDQYPNLSDEDKAVKRSELGNMFEDYQNYFDIKSLFAGGSNVKMSKRFTNTQGGKDLMDAMNNEAQALQVQGGQIGLNIAGEFKNINQLRQLMLDNSVDTVFGEKLQAVIDQQSEVKDFDADYKVNDYTDFIKSKLMPDIRKGANLRSLVYDDVGLGNNFYLDAVDYLNSNVYSRLGVPEDIATDTDGFTEEDKQLVFQKLFENKPLLKEVLGNYYTQIIKQQIDPSILKSDIITEEENNDFNTQVNIDSMDQEAKKAVEEELEDTYENLSILNPKRLQIWYRNWLKKRKAK